MSENIGIGIDQYFSKLNIDIGIANTIVQLLVLILVNSFIFPSIGIGINNIIIIKKSLELRAFDEVAY